MAACYICGTTNQHVLQEHHLIPQRLGGEDTEENTVTLCSNCHNCIESLYDDEFFERLFDHFAEYRQLPLNESSGRPPMGLEYDDFGHYVPASDKFYEIVEAISLRNKNVPLKQVAQITGLTKRQINSACEREEAYMDAWNRTEGSDVDPLDS